MKNRPLKVYISKSMITPKPIIQAIKEKLIASGFDVSEYINNTPYSDYDLRKADVVLVIPEENIKSMSSRNAIRSVSVGKGQYTEANLARDLGKHCIICKNLNQGFMYSKDRGGEVVDSNSWRKRYGILYPIAVGHANSGIDVINAISGLKSKIKKITKSLLFIVD